MVTLFSAETYDEINNKAWSEANGLGLIHRSIDPDKSLKTDTKYERIPEINLPDQFDQSLQSIGKQFCFGQRRARCMLAFKKVFEKVKKAFVWY